MTLEEKYQSIVKRLDEIYKNHHIIVSYSDIPTQDIIEYLKSLDSEEKEPGVNFDLIVRRFIKSRNCFRWRFISKTDPGYVWNPLAEAYQTFKENCKDQIDHWFDDTPFPSEEIIENWIKIHVKDATEEVVQKPFKNQ